MLCSEKPLSGGQDQHFATLFLAREGTQVAVIDPRQKNSCVHVSFTWKETRDFFAGGGLAYETLTELSGANSENSA